MKTLIHGDSLKELKKIENESIDLILTDPPYNIGNFMESRDTNLGALRSNHFVAADWDHMKTEDWERNMDIFLKESARILKIKGSLLIFMSLLKIETITKLAQKHGFYYKTTGIWHKLNPMPRNMNLHFINSTEGRIYFINKGKTGTFNNNNKVMHDFIETSNIKVSEKKYGKHPTQKPIDLMNHFVRLLSNPGDVVLDPFMGSGSTGVASMINNRTFVGIELNKEYYELASIRIKQFSSKLL